MDLTAAEVESNAYEWSWWIIEVSCKTRKGSFLTSTGHRLELIAELVGGGGGGLKEVGAGGRKSCCCSSAAMRGSTLKKSVFIHARSWTVDLDHRYWILDFIKYHY